MIEEMKIRYNVEESCGENRHPGCSNKKNNASLYFRKRVYTYIFK